MLAICLLRARGHCKVPHCNNSSSYEAYPFFGVLSQQSKKED